MGWERKRGKLLDLNKLLRHAFDPFPMKTGDLSVLENVRYVITLDSDTQLPRGSAARMIGTMAHPLNAASHRSEAQDCYGGLRNSAASRRYQRSVGRPLAAGRAVFRATGFDIYTRAVSDVYQDLYGEGIFTGKGIYEVDALRQVLNHRFPQEHAAQPRSD